MYIDFLKYGSVNINKFQYNGNYCVNRFFIADKKNKMKLLNTNIIKKFKKNILMFYLTKKIKKRSMCLSGMETDVEWFQFFTKIIQNV